MGAKSSRSNHVATPCEQVGVHAPPPQLTARARPRRLQILDVSPSRDACFARGSQRRAALVGSLSVIVNVDGPDRYVLAYALEALRRLSDDGDEVARQHYHDALEVSRWCPRTTALSLY